MNIEKFTINSSKRIQEAQDWANREKHNQITPLHLLASMLESQDSLVREIFLELGVDIALMLGNVKTELGRLPKVEGNYQLGISGELQAVFNEADRIASKMKDQYITEEHLLLALIIEGGSEVKSILESFAVSEKVVRDVIGNMR